MTPPAKKAIPSLRDLESNKENSSKKEESNKPSTEEKNENLTTVDTPTVSNDKVLPLEGNHPVSQDSINRQNLDDSFLMPSDGDHVVKWRENHYQNLARVQKDVTVPGKPAEHAGVTRTVTDTFYASESPEDDKGRLLPETKENANIAGENPVNPDSQYADENDNDDRSRKNK